MKDTRFINSEIKLFFEEDMSAFNTDSFTDMCLVYQCILDNADDYVSCVEKYISRKHPDFSFDTYKEKYPKSYKVFTHKVKVELINWFNYFKENSPHSDIFTF